jgi:hypothetical protein
MDDRRVQPLKEFKIPEFQYKDDAPKVVSKRASPMFKFFESIDRGLTVERKASLVNRVNGRIATQMEAIRAQTGEAHFKKLSRANCFAQPSNFERTQSHCFQMLRQKLDVQKLAREERAKLIEQDAMAKAPTTVSKADAKLDQYFKAMLEPKAGSRLSTFLLNEKMREVKGWREEAQRAKRAQKKRAVGPPQERVNYRQYIDIRQLVSDRQRHRPRAAGRPAARGSPSPPPPGSPPANDGLRLYAIGQAKENVSDYCDRLARRDRRTLTSLYFSMNKISNSMGVLHFRPRALPSPNPSTKPLIVQNMFRAGQPTSLHHRPCVHYTIEPEQFVATRKRGVESRMHLSAFSRAVSNSHSNPTGFYQVPLQRRAKYLDNQSMHSIQSELDQNTRLESSNIAVVKSVKVSEGILAEGEEKATAFRGGAFDAIRTTMDERRARACSKIMKATLLDFCENEQDAVDEYEAERRERELGRENGELGRENGELSSEDGFGFHFLPTAHKRLIDVFKATVATRKTRGSALPTGNEARRSLGHRARSEKPKPLEREQYHSVRAAMNTLEMPPMDRVRMIARLAKEQHRNAAEIVSSLAEAARAVREREVTLAKVTSTGYTGMDSALHNMEKRKLIEQSHKCASLAMELYTAFKTFLCFRGKLYTMKMREDEVKHLVRRSKRKLKLSVRLFPVLKSLMQNAQKKSLY